MTLSIAHLPNEVLQDVLCHCADDELATCRRLCSRFDTVASQLLFRHTCVKSTSQSGARMSSVMDSTKLRAHVRTVVFRGEGTRVSPRSRNQRAACNDAD
jgi:hypothetical protein